MSAVFEAGSTNVSFTAIFAKSHENSQGCVCRHQGDQKNFVFNQIFCLFTIKKHITSTAMRKIVGAA